MAESEIWAKLSKIHLISWAVGSAISLWTHASGSVIVNAALAIAIGYWASVTGWIARYGYLPIFLIGLAVFVSGIWAWNGILWMRRQQRPSKARVAFDYGYGLTLDEVIPSHDPENEKNNLEFRFQIRNVAPGPLKYKAERIDVILDDRIKTARDVIGVLPRHSGILLKVGGFEKETIDKLKDRTSGTYEYSIIYGHPEDNYSRRAKKRIHFDLVKRDGNVTGAPWIILDESDETLSGTV